MPAQTSAQRANGAAAGNTAAGDATKRSKAKTPQEGTKIVIRRLPPGLTQDEFMKILGDNWKPKNGKVGWFNFVAGEVSTDPTEPSRPARAYLQILRHEDLIDLENAARAATWQDAKETWNDPALVGPPTIELPLYKKMPIGNKRTDPRQGTIDTDPEYMAFLEEQTQPVVKKQPEEANTDEDVKKKDYVTPLVADLKSKKANKAKEAASTKAAKHARQGSKGKATAVEEGRKGKRGKESAKTEKAAEMPKDVKILTKKATAEAVEAAKAAATQITEATAKKETTPKSRRAGIAAIAKTLQRDLGLSPGNAHRKARQQAAAQAKEEQAASTANNGETTTAQPAAPAASTSTPTSVPTPTAPKAQAQAQAQAPARGRGKKTAPGAESGKGKNTTEKTEAPPVAPKILLKKKPEPVSTVSAPVQPTASTPTTSAPPTGPKASQPKGPAATNNKRSASSAAPTPGATRAFVKHANLSQGVTEPLLKEALLAFGDVTSCEIDRRKGFAYVDFAEPDGLAKALAASPVAVAQARVQVLERKDREPKKSAAQAKGASSAASTTAGNAKETAPSTAAAPPTAPAADKAAGPSVDRQGGRRRGGRNRNTSSKETGGAAASKGSENAPAASKGNGAATAG